MKCLITGISGVVGSNLAFILKNNFNWDIYGIGKTYSQRAKYFQVDLSQNISDDSLRLLPSDIDCVIHCAALIDQNSDPADLVSVNINGSIHALEIANYLGADIFINISGVTVVGDIKIKPLDETHPCNPKTTYLQTKLCAEMILDRLAYDKKIRMIHLRIPSPVGLGMPPRTILPIFLERALASKEIELFGDRRRKQSYLDIRDLAEAIVRIQQYRNVVGVYNIAPARSISNEDLARLIVKKTSSESPIRYSTNDVGTGDIEDWSISFSKALRDFGYSPHFDIEESIDWLLKGKL